MAGTLPEALRRSRVRGRSRSTGRDVVTRSDQEDCRGGHASFRSDIQGLRALAVGLVILAHAGFRTASGGFIGVDVFFVISGFLIIGLLVREAGGSRDASRSSTSTRAARAG